MPATIAPPEQRVVLYNVSWETYERLLADNPNATGTRFAYDEGTLEIMVVHSGHEQPNRSLAQLAELVAEEIGRDYCPAGSTTFRRTDLQKGFEPDSCFYFEHAGDVRGKDQIDLAVDPPPELVIEVDITSSSMNRFPIFAAIGVREVWRYSRERVSIYRLDSGFHREVARSVELPPLTAIAATELLQASFTENRIEWTRRVRAWVSAHR